jgi:hypothetical protein
MPHPRKTPDTVVVMGVVIFLLALGLLFAVAAFTPIMRRGDVAAAKTLSSRQRHMCKISHVARPFLPQA